MENIVKFAIYSTDLRRSFELILSLSSAEDIQKEYSNPTSPFGLIRIEGKLNDADGNDISLLLMRESIGAIEIVEVNGKL